MPPLRPSRSSTAAAPAYVKTDKRDAKGRVVYRMGGALYVRTKSDGRMSYTPQPKPKASKAPARPRNRGNKKTTRGGIGDAAHLPWPEIGLYQWMFALSEMYLAYRGCSSTTDTWKDNPLEIVSEEDFGDTCLKNLNDWMSCNEISYEAIAFNGYWMLFSVKYKEKDDKVYVIAFREMMSASDLKLIIGDTMGLKSFSTIIASVADIMKTHNPDGLIPYYFTGHSMGGLLASLCSIHYDRPAWSFAPFYSRKRKVGSKVYSIGLRDDPIFKLSKYMKSIMSQREELDLSQWPELKSYVAGKQIHDIRMINYHLRQLCYELYDPPRHEPEPPRALIGGNAYNPLEITYGVQSAVPRAEYVRVPGGCPWSVSPLRAVRDMREKN